MLRASFLVLPAVMLAACATSPDMPDEPKPTQLQLVQGHAIAQQRCAACHAIGRYDRSAHPDAPPLRTLGRRYPIYSLEEALAEGMITGHPDMPEIEFQPAEIAALLGYMDSIQDHGRNAYSGSDY